MQGKEQPKQRASKYDEKIKSPGKFMDIINAVVKDAKKKSTKKRK